MVETLTITVDQLTADYPLLENWFESHTTAQILEDRRLLSAEEKLQRLGGKTRIKQIKNSAPGTWPYAVLTACTLDYIVDSEILRFGELVDQRFNAMYVADILRNFAGEEKITKREGITYIEKIGAGGFKIVSNKTGYLLTPKGASALIV